MSDELDDNDIVAIVNIGPFELPAKESMAAKTLHRFKSLQRRAHLNEHRKGLEPLSEAERTEFEKLQEEWTRRAPLKWAGQDFHFKPKEGFAVPRYVALHLRNLRPKDLKVFPAEALPDGFKVVRRRLGQGPKAMPATLGEVKPGAAVEHLSDPGARKIGDMNLVQG